MCYNQRFTSIASKNRFLTSPLNHLVNPSLLLVQSPSLLLVLSPSLLLVLSLSNLLVLSLSLLLVLSLSNLQVRSRARPLTRSRRRHRIKSLSHHQTRSQRHRLIKNQRHHHLRLNRPHQKTRRHSRHLNKSLHLKNNNNLLKSNRPQTSVLHTRALLQFMRDASRSTSQKRPQSKSLLMIRNLKISPQEVPQPVPLESHQPLLLESRLPLLLIKNLLLPLTSRKIRNQPVLHRLKSPSPTARSPNNHQLRHFQSHRNASPINLTRQFT